MGSPGTGADDAPGPRPGPVVGSGTVFHGPVAGPWPDWSTGRFVHNYTPAYATGRIPELGLFARRYKDAAAAAAAPPPPPPPNAPGWAGAAEQVAGDIAAHRSEPVLLAHGVTLALTVLASASWATAPVWVSALASVAVIVAHTGIAWLTRSSVVPTASLDPVSTGRHAG